MLNLKELEENLDQVLAKETSESLKNWLLKKRIYNYKQTFEEGVFENILHTFSGTFSNTTQVEFNIQFKEITFSKDILNAA